MGTTNRRGVSQRIAQQMNHKPIKKKRYEWRERTMPKAFSGRLRFIWPLFAFFGFGGRGFGHEPVEIFGRTPQKRCACGCKKLTFSSTYYNLTHAVLHKREMVAV